MNKFLSIGLTLSAGALAFAGTQTVAVKTVKLFDAIPVLRPVVGTDSLNPHGEKYSAALVLEDAVNTENVKLPSKLLEMNSDSVFIIPRPATGEAISLVKSSFRADRFVKGKLKVVSEAMFDVLIDGKSVAKKSEAQDSVCGASEKTAKITLEPDVVKNLTIKVLTSAEAPSDATLRVAFVPDDDFKESDVVFAPEMKNRFLLETTIIGTRARRTNISPDGRYMLTSFMSQPKAEEKGSRFTTLTETRTGKEIAGNLPQGTDWMPDGATLYYTRKAANGFDVYTMIPNGAPSLKYQGLPTDEFYWLPDGHQIIYSTSDDGEKEEGPLRRYLTPDDRIPGDRTRSFLKLYDCNTGVTRTLTYGRRSTLLSDISADGRYILYITPQATPDKHPFMMFDLTRLDLTTMKADTLVKENGFLANAVFSPDAKKVAITGSPRTFGNLGVNAGSQPIVNDFDTQIYILDIATGDIKPMTRDFNPSVKGGIRWNRADGKIYFLANNEFSRNLYALNPVDGKISRMPTAGQSTMDFSMGDKEANYIGYVSEGYDDAGKAYLLNVRSGKSVLTADPLRPELDKIEFGKSERWKFTASDGTIIDGTITLPPDFDSSKKYPLLVYYYGGTSPSEYMMSHPYVPQLYASRGYVVYVINPSGTYGYGQEFSARHVNAWGKRTADDIIEGVKQFCKEHPFVNDKKIGCFGASYGGFMTQYLQTKTDIFAAAVSHAGISNVTSYWGEGFWGYSYNSVAASGSYPWTDPELFTRQGSLFNADKIHTPLLLIHGTADTNVPVGESIQLFNALKILGRDVQFITVADEDHVSGGYPWTKRILWQNTLMAWFDKYLKDQPQWWDEMYPERHL